MASLCTLVLLAVTASQVLSGSFLLPGARYMSGRFAFHVAPGGAETLYMLDLGGDTLTSQPLPEHMPRVGPGYDAPFYALVDKHVINQERKVTVLAFDPGDPTARTVSAAFAIPFTYDVGVGQRSLVVKPRAEHGTGSAFDLRFRSLFGDSVLTSQTLGGFTLLAIENIPYDYWVTYSIASDRSRWVHAFTRTGELLWSFAPTGIRKPTTGISPTRRHSVNGVLNDDNYTSRLAVLDSSGAVTATRNVPGFRVALYSPDENLLALAGHGTVQLLNARSDSASTIWVERRGSSLAAGEAVAFSSDSSRLHVLTQERRFGQGPSEAWLYTFRNLLASPPTVDSLQVDIPAEARIGVADMREVEYGRVRIVTGYGVSLVP